MILIAVSLEQVYDILAENSGVNPIYFIWDIPTLEIAMKVS